VLKAYIRRKRPTVDIDEISMVDVSPGPGEIYVRRREQRLLLKALRMISIERQILFELRYWEALESPEIAEILGIPDNTARSRLSRAEADLRAVMARLASSPAELASTIDNLDDWARRCRDELSPARESPAVYDDSDE
jgi:RNA polymerase sigma-70 factor (ECF subfamily)